jgi:hypothetical protein
MLISANKKGVDNVVWDIFKGVDSPIPIVILTRMPAYEFNTDLLSLDRYIIANYSEYGWDFAWSNGTPIFGKNIDQDRDLYPGDEWSKFIDFVDKKPPVLTLQRELLASDVSDTVKPVDYPNWNEPYPLQTKEQFEKRPISLFNFWGRSNEQRLRVHAEIWLNASQKGHDVCDNIYYLEKFLTEQNEGNGKRWVSLNIPHYARVDVKHILGINGLSKLSLSMPGSGKKCFRHTSESPVNSVMVKQADSLAWSYSWKHNVNCIEARPGQEIEAIEQALQNPALYYIYREGVALAEKYRPVNYYPDYIEKLIKEHT